MGSYGLQVGRADVRSAGPITFGPEGILFLADNVSATVFAVDVGDTGRGSRVGAVRPGRTSTCASASFLGCEADDIVIRDMAVHPISHNVYLSVQRGHGDAAPGRCWCGSTASTARSPTCRSTTCPSPR